MLPWTQNDGGSSSGPLPWDDIDESYLIAALIVVSSFFVAKLVDLVVTGIVRMVAKRTDTDLDDRLLESLHGPIVKTVVLVGLWFACNRIELAHEPLPWIHQFLLSLGILVFTFGSFFLLPILHPVSCILVFCGAADQSVVINQLLIF